MGDGYKEVHYTILYFCVPLEMFIIKHVFKNCLAIVCPQEQWLSSSESSTTCQNFPEGFRNFRDTVAYGYIHSRGLQNSMTGRQKKFPFDQDLSQICSKEWETQVSIKIRLSGSGMTNRARRWKRWGQVFLLSICLKTNILELTSSPELPLSVFFSRPEGWSNESPSLPATAECRTASPSWTPAPALPSPWPSATPPPTINTQRSETEHLGQVQSEELGSGQRLGPQSWRHTHQKFCTLAGSDTNGS